MATALIVGERYSHRYNRDGTVDSICMACFLTAAKATNVRMLSQQESVHRCWHQEEGLRSTAGRGAILAAPVTANS